MEFALKALVHPNFRELCRECGISAKMGYMCRERLGGICLVRLVWSFGPPTIGRLALTNLLNPTGTQSFTGVPPLGVPHQFYRALYP